MKTVKPKVARKENSIDTISTISSSGKGRSGSKMLLKKTLISFIIVIIAGAGLYALSKAGYLKPSGQIATQEQAVINDQNIVAQLKTVILLPDDIMPTMAIVTDADVLKQQQPGFFADAKNGDYLIIYPDLAIIYDYQANKIIKVGPVESAPVQDS